MYVRKVTGGRAGAGGKDGGLLKEGEGVVLCLVLFPLLVGISISRIFPFLVLSSCLLLLLHSDYDMLCIYVTEFQGRESGGRRAVGEERSS